MACAANQSVVVCGKEVCRYGCAYILFYGTISVYGASDFSHFFNMAACPNHTTSSYRCIVGLTKRSPIIPTQTLSLHNTKYHGYGKYSLSDVSNNTLRDHFTHHY